MTNPCLEAERIDARRLTVLTFAFLIYSLHEPLPLPRSLYRLTGMRTTNDVPTCCHPEFPVCLCIRIERIITSQSHQLSLLMSHCS